MENTSSAQIALALAALLGENMAETLLLIADLASAGDPVPLRSGLSCFHFWHNNLLCAHKEQEPLELLFSTSRTGYCLHYFLTGALLVGLTMIDIIFPSMVAVLSRLKPTPFAVRISSILSRTTFPSSV